MSTSNRRRIVGLVAAFLLVVLAIVGVRAWQLIAPALGWTSPVVDTVPPALPAGLERAPLAILEFSKTSGFRHREAIPAARASLEAIAKRNGWALFSTENAAVFNDEQLSRFDVVFGNNITGDNWTAEQKAAFTRAWDPQTNKMSLLKWIIARRAAKDLILCGHRPNSDCGKMKDSVTHVFNIEEGWCYTDWFGGRSKLTGAKKNSRKWRQYSLCWCEGGIHRSPTLRDRYNLDQSGNPREGYELGFDTRCIIAGFEFTNLWLPRDEWRRYPNLVGEGRGKSLKGNVGNGDIGKPINLALEFLVDQGLPKFDSNCGRKASGRMYKHLNIPYEHSFEIHGDGYGVWESKYQQGCRRLNPNFTRRDQSKEPDIATTALRKISVWMGLGARQPTVELSINERQMDLVLRAMGLPQQANDILLGLNVQLPSDYAPRGLPKPEPSTVKPESIQPVKSENN